MTPDTTLALVVYSHKGRTFTSHTGTDDRLTECVREAWRNSCENGTADTVRLFDIASTMIARDDDVAACAHTINWRGIDFPDYEGLTFRIVAILPQVMQ